MHLVQQHTHPVLAATAKHTASIQVHVIIQQPVELNAICVTIIIVQGVVIIIRVRVIVVEVLRLTMLELENVIVQIT